LGKNGNNCEKSRENVSKKKNCQNFEIKSSKKKKRLLLMNEKSKVIQIIPTLIYLKISSSIFEIIINLSKFFGKFLIDINDVTKKNLEVNFHRFSNIERGHKHQ